MKPNKHGVYVDYEREVLFTLGYMETEIRIATDDDGMFVGAYSVHTSTSGCGSAPWVGGKKYSSREECRKVQYDAIKKWIYRESLTEKEKAIVDKYYGGKEQLELF